MKRIFAHIGFSFAVALVVLNFLSLKWAIVAFVVLSEAFVICIAIKKTRQAVAVPLCLASAAVAALLYIGCYSSTVGLQQQLYDESADTEFYITDLETTSSSGTSFKYYVKTKSIDKVGAPQNINLVLYSGTQIDVDYYEVVRANLKFSQLAENGYSSGNYYGKNIFMSAYAYNYEDTGQAVSNPLKYILNLRESIRDIMVGILGEEYGGIAVALLTGDKSGITDEISDNFRTSGVSHLLAVSGLHISVLIGSLYWLLRRLAVPKVPRTVISSVFILFYIALSGFSTSIIRAGIMMLVMFIARIVNEHSDSLNSLGLAVFLICLNPFAVTDISAQLTVTAVLGILLIYPKFGRIKKIKSKIIQYPLNTIALSVSVFISTFPSMLLFFGTVSTIGALINIVMVPLGEVALILSTILLMVFKIPFLEPVTAFLDSVVIRLMVVITGDASSLYFAMADIGNFTTALITGVILIVFGVVFLTGKKKYLKYATVFSLVMALCVSSVMAFTQRNSIKVRVISGYDTDAVIVYNNDGAVVIGVQDSSQYYTAHKIVNSNGLDIVLLIDSASSTYSRKLAQMDNVLNYACTDSSVSEMVDAENFIYSASFESMVGENINIKYSSDTGVTDITVYNTNFTYNTYGIEDGYDTIYTIDKDRYSMTRVNEWLQ